MRGYIIGVIIWCSVCTQGLFGQTFTITGKILNSKSKEGVGFAAVSFADNRLWTVADEAGRFVLRDVPGGKTVLLVHCLGYVTKSFDIEVKNDMPELVFLLAEENLALDEVVVTARQKPRELTTSYTIDRTTLDHAQILNVSSIRSLLPGGKTSIRQGLTTDERFALRAKGGEKGNASFGTAIEVDGVRIQNNAAFDETKGADIRSISSTNIESVEVVTGIPSVEHGDLSSGLVKIHTRKGKTPLTVELSTSPGNKQAAVSKGFSLGKDAGTLNTSFEHTKSVPDPASPYTSYARNAIAVKYSHTLNKSRGMPLSFDLGLTGNIGGYDSKTDPDAFRETYTYMQDNSLRANANARWLLNKAWITNLEFSGSVSYSDRLSKLNTNRSSSSSQASLHSLEQGYFIATNYDEDPDAPVLLLPRGYWYVLQYHDSKPVHYTAKIKADWQHLFGSLSHKLMVGAELSSSSNKGRGVYYNDLRYAPTWRPYRYNEKPSVNNIAWYIEDKLSLPLRQNASLLEVTTGIRSDMTMIRSSAYGTVQSFSPRVNAKYTLRKNADGMLSDFSLYAGWGKSVKLPSHEVLYPRPTYSDDLAFAPGAMADGSTFYAYYTTRTLPRHNPDLRWQHNEQYEFGTEFCISGVKVNLSFFRSQTVDPYICTLEHTPYSYRLTDQKALEQSTIPLQNRKYTIDRETGIVTVSDKTGAHSSHSLEYTTRDTYKTNYVYRNGSPIERNGIEWTVEFPRIRSIRTKLRLDGNYYRYKGVDETLIASVPAESMTDNTPFRYIGYYVGSSTSTTSYRTGGSIVSSIQPASPSVSNGGISEEVNLNVTSETHIPAIRMIFTVKLEASLYQYSRRLSQYKGRSYGFVMSKPEHLSGEDTDIYQGDVYVGTYPLYYSTWEDPDTKIPFAEKFAWAKENDKDLYNELAKMVLKSNTNYFFNPNRISPYFSANIHITKEIGKYASISFYAHNFFNNMGKVKFSNNRTETILYESGFIPQFTYGLSLRLKL